MIRKLVEDDRKMLLEYLSEEASINLFIIGDIEAFGFDTDFQEIWGQFRNGIMEGVLLRFNENFIPYWKTNQYDISEFEKIIKSVDGEIMISGKESIVKKFTDIQDNLQVKSTYFCELRSKDNLEDYDDSIKLAGIEDSKRICDFIDSIEEFNALGNTPDRIKHKIETKTGRVYYIENENKEIVSVSQTSAENTMSAMVVGVATNKAFRRKGLVTKGLSKLCSDVLEEGKTLCLFYDNPQAGTIYHKLGFKLIDNWMMISQVK